MSQSATVSGRTGAASSPDRPSTPPTPRSLKIWLDGQLVDKADAKISVYDHGLLYGDGVFEGIRCYSGKIFECDAHVRRLYDSAKVRSWNTQRFCARGASLRGSRFQAQRGLSVVLSNRTNARQRPRFR